MSVLNLAKWDRFTYCYKSMSKGVPVRFFFPLLIIENSTLRRFDGSQLLTML